MQAEIDGKTQIVPICTCGKCVVKRMRKEHFLSYPYNKNLQSIYKDDFGPTNSGIPFNDRKNDYIKAKGCNISGVFKDHIPTSLMSTNKMDYKPFKVQLEELKPNKHEIEKAPFIGSTTNKAFYNNWGSTLEDKSPTEKFPDIKVPLRGDSNYKQSYPRFPKSEYEKKDMKIIPKSNLEFFGKLNPETSYGNCYQPVDFKQPHYFNKDDKTNKSNSNRTNFVSAEFPPSNFESSYKRSIGNFDNSTICQLREFLVKKGKTCLEV